jgi:hypothetical protein
LRHSHLDHSYNFDGGIIIIIIIIINKNAVKNNDMNIANKFFEREEQFKYLGRTLAKQNFIHEEIKKRLKLQVLAIIQCTIFCLPVWYP